jgi:hypothetical protein
MSKPPLRPATPIDPELAEPHPDADTEIGKAEKLGDDNKKKPPADRKSEKEI